MPKVVAENCVACGACADVCPESAITVDDVAVIDSGKCVDCGACIDECPSDALVRGPARPPKAQNHSGFPGGESRTSCPVRFFDELVRHDASGRGLAAAGDYLLVLARVVHNIPAGEDAVAVGGHVDTHLD